MSTTLTVIKGRKEIPDSTTRTSNYSQGELYVTRFSGGIENGVMLQLSTGITQDAHIQLNREQIEELKAALEKF